MNTNGNNLSLTIFKNEPYLPTELWDIINYYKYMFEIQDKIKEKKAMFDGIHNTFKFARRIGKIEIFGSRYMEEGEETNITLFEFFCMFGHWGFAEDMSPKCWVDYYNIWDENGWDWGGGMYTVKDFLELREEECIRRDQAKSIYWKPSDIGITEGMVNGEEEVY